MALARFLQGAAFGPDEIAILVAAYDAAFHELDLISPTDARAETLAKTIVMLAKQGERDPVRLRKRAIAAMSGLPPDAATA
jgi:hypothetical protein